MELELAEIINTWFISDTHFGHKNILEYEKLYRPFKTLQEMHEVMIDRWNDVVRPKDTVYHLGDFAFGKNWVNIAERLNGNKNLVMGNHDTYKTDIYLKHFNKCYGVVFWRQCILTHIPVNPKQLGSRCLLNVHGHLHSKVVYRLCDTPENINDFIYTLDLRYFNVSCERNYLTPIHEDVIMQRLKIIKELDE